MDGVSEGVVGVGGGIGIAGLVLLLATPSAILAAIFAGFVLSLCWRRPTPNRDTHQSNTTTDNTTTNSGEMSESRRPSTERECPICIDPPTYAVETNCGHIFCAKCFVQNWQTNFTVTPTLCPFCRQEVTLLIPCLTDNEQNTTDETEIREREHTMGEVGQYNRMYSTLPRSFTSQIMDLPTLLRHLWREIFTWQGLAMLSKIRILFFIVLGVVYAIVPIDLIPEAFLGVLGVFDDIVVALVILLKSIEIYRDYVANREW
ncbi:hypothetical protein Pmani_023409 [Petrolisthes manimaculis]|uniref:E3 ubiquitin-protein ligase RNF170 n=1 Tax=Petrolisthes manimaculis TaxID=1843537 RepID=A0AAE1U144_9EUCA|nr:hypothetical protein Pmani_023409 [Petrolisthes manimaculis]